MTLPKIPVHSLDDINHRRGARERINAILDHSFDDSKIQTPEEKLAGITPVNPAFRPVNPKRYGAKGDGVTDDTGAVAQAISASDPLTAIDLDNSTYSTTAFDNSIGAQFQGAGYVETNDVVKTPWGRRNPHSFGAELLFALHKRIFDGDAWRATFTGDSTTLGTGVDAGYTIPELFLKGARRSGAVGGVMRNRGQSGQSSADWLSTYLSGAGGDLDPQPHLLVIRWGINDGDTSGDNLTPAQTIENIRTGLATIRGTANCGVSELSIILCTPNSTSDSARGRDERYYEQLIHGFRQAALDYDCAFLDIYSLAQNSRGGSYAAGEAAAGNWMDDPFTDGRAVHPGNIMNMVIADETVKLAFTGIRLFGGAGCEMDDGQSSTKDGDDLPETYSTGVTLFRADTDFPRNGFALTFNHDDDGQFQINWGFGSAIERTVRTRFGRANAWDAFDGEYIAPSLLNSWANVGGTAEVAGYTRDMYGRVSLKGRIAGGTTTAATALFTLPSGYRPSGNAVFPAPCSTGIGQVQVIASTGNVQIVNVPDNTYLALDGINFMATQ